ncbi:MAG TPA: tannase/feruloyl esterase family alpha/beta hydrolase [Candidatus Acidoferrum sp.]|nr:tannase/feruloyl esterase family alpha/beta hydrolase [Candidatus Acidoferrum sp.]
MHTRMLRLLPLAGLLIAAIAVHAQPAATLTGAACAQLQTIAITPAQIGEPVSKIVIDSAAWVDAAPAHCRIDGHLDPVDTSATARPIKFGVVLPASWNGRAIHLGGGGMNGTVPQLVGRGEQSDTARGYATFGSDSGHTTTDQQWLLNEEAIKNLGYLQMKKTHDVAFVLIGKAYGSAPKYTYWVGGSQGGREGLTMAQRYPKDYDGIVVTVPIVGFSSLMLGPSRIRIHEKSLASWVPASKGTAILTEFMRQCDRLDGIADGVINNYVDCRAQFNVNDNKGDKDPWAKLRCPNDVDPAPNDAGKTACLTSAQIKTVEYIFSDLPATIKLPNGRSNFGMWTPTTAVVSQFPAFGGPPPAAPPAAGANAPRPPGPPAMPAGFAFPGAVFMSQRYRGQDGAAADAPVFTTLGTDGVTGLFMQNPAANPLDYDEAVHGKRQQQLAPWLDSTQADLGAFAARGGKLIVTIGTDDTIAAPGEQLNYYQTVLDTMGRANVDKFARLYVLPQTGHGLTGRSAAIDGDGNAIMPTEIPSRVDRFALLTQWVEQGKAPAMAVEVSGQNATRPMCSYPDYPRYQGGDVNSAASFTCTKPKFAP